MARGTPARRRRVSRRASDRSHVEGAGRALDAASLDPASDRFTAEFAEAVGLDKTFTSKPGMSFTLSDRQASWDAGEASKAWQAECGIDGDSPDWTKFHTGFFYYDADKAETVGGHKLQFVDVIDGKTIAVWRGITAVAGALQGARGGVQIPESDAADAKAAVEKWYAKAAKAFDDDSIKVPWDDSASFASPAVALAIAEVGSLDATRYFRRVHEWSQEFASGDVVWDDEDGIMDLMSDLSKQLNGDGDMMYRWWVADVALSLDKAIICDWSDDSNWMAPFTIGDDKEPTLSPSSDWMRLEGAWIESNDDYAAARARFAASGDCANCNHAMSMHEDGTGACSEPGCTCTAYESSSASLTAAAIPASANYRVAADGASKTCGDCDAYSSGQCSMWDAAVEADHVCDSWEAKGTASATPWTLAAGDGCMSCGHAMSSHENDMGECSVASCSCMSYASGEGYSVLWDGTNWTLAADSVADTLPDAHKPGSKTPARRKGPKPPEVAAPMPTGPIQWTADFCPEARLTDDKRAFAPGSIDWRELPLTLMGMTVTSEGGHIGAELCGRIDSIWRDEAAGMIRASGVFDTGDYGAEIARLVEDGTLRGVSVDLAIHSYDVGPQSDWFDEDGNWAPKPAAAADTEEPSLMDILFGTDEDSIAVVTSATIGMCTVCPFPAFAEANIVIGESLVAGSNPGIWTVRLQGGFTLVEGPSTLVAAAAASHAGVTGSRPVELLFPEDEALTAAGGGLAPVVPPSDWFEDPELEEVTGIVVTEDGQVYGHAAVWGTCHTAFHDRCRTAPHSEHDYAYFHLGEILCDDGRRVACGQITLNTGHADQTLGRVDAARHYDHTGAAVADVRVGEDEHGIWVAGAVRPTVSAEVVRELRGAKLSGDWRGVNGNLELIALLAVNVPGFPVTRARVSVQEGESVALIAAGIPILESDLPPEDRERFAELRTLAEQATV